MVYHYDFLLNKNKILCQFLRVKLVAYLNSQMVRNLQSILAHRSIHFFRLAYADDADDVAAHIRTLIVERRLKFSYHRFHLEALARTLAIELLHLKIWD